MHDCDHDTTRPTCTQRHLWAPRPLHATVTGRASMHSGSLGKVQTLNCFTSATLVPASMPKLATAPDVRLTRGRGFFPHGFCEGDE